MSMATSCSRGSRRTNENGASSDFAVIAAYPFVVVTDGPFPIDFEIDELYCFRRGCASFASREVQNRATEDEMRGNDIPIQAQTTNQDCHFRHAVKFYPYGSDFEEHNWPSGPAGATKTGFDSMYFSQFAQGCASKCAKMSLQIPSAMGANDDETWK
jgi:hypothetical protein